MIGNSSAGAVADAIGAISTAGAASADSVAACKLLPVVGAGADVVYANSIASITITAVIAVVACPIAIVDTIVGTIVVAGAVVAVVSAVGVVQCGIARITSTIDTVRVARV